MTTNLKQTIFFGICNLHVQKTLPPGETLTQQAGRKLRVCIYKLLSIIILQAYPRCVTFKLVF